MQRYTKQQRALLKLWQENKLKRLNILQGAVRSGKTWISIILWIFFVASAPKGSKFLMSARTLTTLQRNVLEPMSEIVGKQFSYSLSKKEANLFGQKIYLEGAGDSGAESKIRGMTIYGAYCDELTLMPESFFAMLLSRMSMKGAKLIATTNPDSPNHWLYRKYLARTDLDLLNMNFSIDDNKFLPKKYVEELKKEYTGVFYKRYIEGKWAVAEGIVYPMFSFERHVQKSDTLKGEFYISVDYGTLNPCSMGLWVVASGKAHRLGEYYHDGRTSQTLMTDEEYYHELEKLAADYPIQYVVVDPSAASFIEVIRRHGRFSVRKANNNVLYGIRLVSSLLSEDKLTFDPSCKAIIREFGAYAWDESAPCDKVIKESDHAMDDMRYFVMTVLKFLGPGKEV